MDYKWPIAQTLKREGIDSDIDVVPINEEIIDFQVVKILESAVRRDAGDETTRDVPRNIRGLFHLPIGDAGLKTFQKRVVDQISASPHGETAWEMIRHMVVGFEQARNGDFSGSHRDIPDDLESAQRLFAA